LYEANRFGIEELKKFIKKNYKLEIKPLVATEGIMFCRGGNLEDFEAYDRDKLISWLFAMLPSLINKDRLTLKTRV